MRQCYVIRTMRVLLLRWFIVDRRCLETRRKVKQREDKKMSATGTVILPVVLYGCETWSLTLREERRLRVFGNRC